VTVPSRVPVLVLDRAGYAGLRGADGRPYLDPDRYAVHLVTGLDRLGQVRIDELASVVAVPPGDDPALAAAARCVAVRAGGPVARVVALREDLLLLAAALRDELGLPGPGLALTRLFRDKVAMKAHLRRHGIAVPDWAPLGTPAARDLAATGAVLVAKPRLGLGNRDIHELRGGAELAAFTRDLGDRVGGYQVERFVTGQLCHVDSVVSGGTVVVATAGRYLDGTLAYRRLAPCRSVAVAPGPDLAALLEFNRRVLACFPGYTGVAHHEVFLTGAGPVLCEIGARAGGGGIAAGFASRTGLDLAGVAVAAQVGGTVPAPVPVAGHLTGFTLLYRPAGVLRRPLRAPDEPWVLHARVLAHPGQRLSAPAGAGDAVAVVSVRGGTEAEVTGRLERVRQSMCPVPDPPP